MPRGGRRGARNGQPMGGRGRGVAVRKRQAVGGALEVPPPRTRRAGHAGRARGKRAGKREKGQCGGGAARKGKYGRK